MEKIPYVWGTCHVFLNQLCNQAIARRNSDVTSTNTTGISNKRQSRNLIALAEFVTDFGSSFIVFLLNSILEHFIKPVYRVILEIVLF